MTKKEKARLAELKNHVLWPRFAEWAPTLNIDLTHLDDWENWFICYCAGAVAGEQYLREQPE